MLSMCHCHDMVHQTLISSRCRYERLTAMAQLQLLTITSLIPLLITVWIGFGFPVTPIMSSQQLRGVCDCDRDLRLAVLHAAGKGLPGVFACICQGPRYGTLSADKQRAGGPAAGISGCFSPATSSKITFMKTSSGMPVRLACMFACMHTCL